MSDSALYIASTPLVALLACAAARAQRVQAQLVLIEDFPDAAAWRDVIARWRDNPFAAIGCVPGRASEARAVQHRGRFARERIKRALRHEAFATLAAIDAAVRPARVWVGNDRRPETQFALDLARRRRDAACGVYLDDGLFSYVGDAHARPFARAVVDTALKRLAYGRYWRHAAIVGTTPYIAEAWLAWPDLALDRDPRRARRALPPDWFRGRALARLLRGAWRAFAGDRRPRHDLVLALPHSRLVREARAAATLRARVEALARAGACVAVKYHPRELDADPLGLVEAGATLLPGALTMELIAARLPRAARVAGEASTALAAARWLRPDLRIADLGLIEHDFARRARAFLARIGVEVESRA
jgi:hypothetical protein